MKRVAVLRGGPSKEYDVSMQSGKAVLEALNLSDYQAKDIIITKKGEWLDSGFARRPDHILNTVDVAFVALHGTYGEDGQVQRILQRMGIPFTGSRSMASSIAFNKELTKNTLRPHGIKMPRHRRLNRADLAYLDEQIDDIFTDIGNELFIKPMASGSSFGAQYVPNKESFVKVIDGLSKNHNQFLIEEFIRGKEATVGVLNGYRNQDLYVLPVIEIVPPNNEPMFSYENKYNGSTEEIVPGRFSYHEKSQLADIASLVHKVIDCANYSRSDFIVKDGEVYFLEVNTLPGLTPQSLYPKAASAIGLEFKDLIGHLLENASR
jgi:D-alanine--D-alanine ligase